MGVATDKHRLFVWDLPTRLFHWIVVAAVIVAWATGDADDGFWFNVHLAAGYTLLAALIFRLIWGFAGSRHALFGDFLRSWPAVRDYARRLLGLRPPHSTGHNPLGGWMVILLLLVLAAVVATGLFGGESDEAAAGPLVHLIAPALAEELVDVHEVLFNVLLVLVGIHIAGVITDIALTGDNLVAAMITGYKRVPANRADAGAGSVSYFRAAVALAIGVAVTVYLVSL
jgi:cytochrome b